MKEEYIALFILFVLTATISCLALWLTYFVGPRRPSQLKQKNYESGMEVAGPAWVRFHVRYYLVAILFLLFDLELALFYPWAITLLDQPPLGFWSMMVFLAVLTVGFVYEWQKRVLEWH